MSRTIDSMVEAHRVVRARQDAGLPVWDRRVSLKDVFHNDALTFEQRRDAIAGRLRSSGWVASVADDFGGLADAIEGLAHAEDAEEFNGWFDEIYDHADADRVWIETR